jgi:ketosteroid isomerase-like protein
MTADPKHIVERLQRAINTRNLDALTGCFCDDVESCQPAHPARNFRGCEQLRRNWTQILASVPDLRAELLGCLSDGTEAWAEWQWRGTHHDGSAFELRGVTMQRARDGAIAAVRFYMEPVERAGLTIDAAVAQLAVGR